MSVVRISLIALGIAAAATVAAAAATETLPAGKTASGITLTPGPRGGRILVAHEDGVSNPVAGLRMALAAGGGYFDRAPVARSVVASADGRAAYGAFDATIRGTPVSGVTIVALRSSGAAEVVALFDRPSRLSTSLRPMLAALDGAPRGSAHAGHGATVMAPAEPLREYDLPDGSGSAALPPSWTVTSANQGQLMAHDPSNTQNADLGVSLPLTDPRAGMGARIAANSGGIVMTYEPDPAAAYVAFANVLGRRVDVAPNVTIVERREVPAQVGRSAFIGGSQTNPKGVREAFFGFVSVGTIGPMGGYVMTITMVSGPAKRVAAQGATLANIFESYRVNGGVRAGQTLDHERETIAKTQATIAGIEATGAASMENAAASQSAIDRSTSAYVHYLGGTDVVESIGSGTHASTDADFAQDLARSDPQNFRIVPMSEYRAGD